jgi:hypothetical protein
MLRSRARGVPRTSNQPDTKSERRIVTTTRSSTSKGVAATAVLVGLAAMWIVWPANRDAAADEYLDEFLAYGVANISPGQTARLHVVTVGIRDAHPAELVIYDRLGNTLALSREDLLPGRAVALDLRFDQGGIAVVGNRLEFYAAVRFAKRRGGYVIPTLEVIEDATGRTVRAIVDPIG